MLPPASANALPLPLTLAEIHDLGAQKLAQLNTELNEVYTTLTQSGRFFVNGECGEPTAAQLAKAKAAVADWTTRDVRARRAREPQRSVADSTAPLI
jgi:hypothetical protein